jgi:peptidoglycan/xylan/chitin deacetylase (PgdA/CDA1 family)
VAKERMMTTRPQRHPRVLRRTVLLGVAGVVIGAGTLGVEAEARATHADRDTRRGRRNAVATLVGAPVMPPPAPPVTPPAGPPAPPPVISTHVPHWAHRWHAPIYDLDDFLRRDRQAHFPHRSIMLTVDDGPHPVWTPRYLRLFAKHHVTATFNLIGEQVHPNRKIVRALVAEGHTVANHTWTHDERLPFRSRRDIHREIARTNEAIHDVTGLRPTQFRAPGGAWGAKVFAELAREQMMPVDWNIDPRDWARPGTPAIESAMRATRPGDIILCHDGGGDRSQTYRALKKIIPELKHRGLRFVTLP